MKNSALITGSVLAQLYLFGLGFAQATERPEFSLPVGCDEGQPCLLQNLVDMDTSNIRLDALCGRSTYNGHKGTDFRVVNIPQMEKGVPVLAMADGVVVGLRNSQPDILVETAKHKIAVRGKECGNGLILDHGKFGGKRWTSQYCHLKQGSVNFKKGAQIKRGQAIGEIGLSGHTMFPHVHITVRAGKTLYDPLTGITVQPNKPQCSAKDADPLFTAEAMAKIKAGDSPLMEAGFADRAVKDKDIMKGAFSQPRPRRPMVFYAYFKNLLKGDKIRLVIKSGSNVWMKSTTEPLKVDKSSYTVFAGRRKGGKKKRTYHGTAEIIRGDKVVFTSEPVSLSFKGSL